ncbi:MAG: helix-turn-helix domain-containing protein [Cytophagales bacterium]|nr:MAG: helix-turn-helix domain-containing protein [Cytophagales bacterium]
MKSYSLEELTDEYVGKIGTEARTQFENELRLDLLGFKIKQIRKERNLTQAAFGLLAGVQKSQISKLESCTNSATIDTIIKVFAALKAEINFNVKLENQFLKLA